MQQRLEKWGPVIWGPVILIPRVKREDSRGFVPSGIAMQYGRHFVDNVLACTLCSVAQPFSQEHKIDLFNGFPFS